MNRFKWKKGDPSQEIPPECGNPDHVLQIEVASTDIANSLTKGEMSWGWGIN